MTYWNFWIRFVLASLATWRVTHLLAYEDGPGDIIVRLRARLGRRWAGRLMDCFHCLSLWIAALAAVFVSRQALGWLLSWLAVSGAACLLDRTEEAPVTIHPIAREPGETNYVLRSETDGVEGHSTAGGQNGASGSSVRK